MSFSFIDLGSSTEFTESEETTMSTFVFVRRRRVLKVVKSLERSDNDKL